MKGTRGGMVLLLGLLVAMVVWATDAGAQSTQPGEPGGAPGIERPGTKPVPPAGQPAAGGKQILEGKIKTMAGNKLTLDNGAQLTLPDTMMGQRSLLKEGMTVKASYEEKGGEKVVTSMDVRPTEDRPAGGKPGGGQPSEKPAPK